MRWHLVELGAVIGLLGMGFQSRSMAQLPDRLAATLSAPVVKDDYAPSNHSVRLNIMPSNHTTNYLPEFDVFVTTNATAFSNGLDAINWSWLRRTRFGDTNLLLPNLWSAKPYFLLGTMLDSDMDSLPDAFETVVSKTNPKLRDSNNNGIEDGDEMGANRFPWRLEQVRRIAAVIYASKPEAAEGGPCGQFTVCLPEPAPKGGATIHYRVHGSAVLGEEFTISPNTHPLTIPANSNSATISVCAVDTKAYSDLDLYVEITLTSCSSSPVFEHSARIDILDNDLPAVRVLPIPPQLDEPSRAYGTNAGQFYFIRDGNGANPVAVNFSIGGTGQSGVNYAALPKVINFPANVQTASLRIMPLRDIRSYVDRTVVLTITGAKGYQIDPQNGVATVTIINHDLPPLPVVQVVATIRHATVSSLGQFTFTRSVPATDALRIHYGVDGDTVVDYKNGQPVISYRALPGYVDIPAGQTKVTVPVIPVNPPPNGVRVTVTIRAEGDYSVGSSRAAAVQIGRP